MKTTESGGPTGYDAGKKVNGRKRQVMVDTDVRGLIVEPQAASVQRRRTARAAPVAPLVPVREHGLRRQQLCWRRPATATCINVEIARKPKDQIGFAVHPRRWVVERFFAWISRNRRLWSDPEATLASAEAFLYAASVMILVRRIARAA